MALLTIKELTLNFSGLVAIHHLSLQVPKGNIFSLIGPNGAGKTTVFNCITKLYQWTSGAIHFNDHSLLELETHQLAPLGIARTFQNIRLFPDMTVLDNVLVGQHARLSAGVLGTLFRLPTMQQEEQEARAVTLDCLHFVNLAERANHLAKNLAYGEQRRLEIARALATEPTLLLLDEPAAGMNPQESSELIHLIQKIRDRGITPLLIEHDMRVVMGISDHIVVMNFGEKIAEGPPEHIQNHPDVIEAYLGGT